MRLWLPLEEGVVGFLDSLKTLLRGGTTARGSGGGRSDFGDDTSGYWIYVRCRRCGEPLKSRVNMMNDPSLADDGETWIVRKGVIGSGRNLCFQTIEVTLRFDARKQKVIESEAVGGELITAEEYAALLLQDA